MSFTTRAMSLLLGLGLLAGCASKAITISPEDVHGPETWGRADNVMRLKHLYFSGQPGAPELEVAKENGVEIVINLRESSELNGTEAQMAAEAGLQFYNVPVTRRGPLESAAMAEIEAILDANAGKKTLLHCRSGSRAGMFLATHLVSQHNLPVDDAIAVAEKAGMKVGQEKVRDYFSAQ